MKNKNDNPAGITKTAGSHVNHTLRIPLNMDKTVFLTVLSFGSSFLYVKVNISKPIKIKVVASH